MMKLIIEVYRKENFNLFVLQILLLMVISTARVIFIVQANAYVFHIICSLYRQILFDNMIKACGGISMLKQENY